MRVVRRVSSVCGDYSLPRTNRLAKDVKMLGFVSGMDIAMTRVRPVQQGRAALTAAMQLGGIHERV